MVAASKLSSTLSSSFQPLFSQMHPSTHPLLHSLQQLLASPFQLWLALRLSFTRLLLLLSIALKCYLIRVLHLLPRPLCTLLFNTLHLIRFAFQLLNSLIQPLTTVSLFFRHLRALLLLYALYTVLERCVVRCYWWLVRQMRRWTTNPYVIQREEEIRRLIREAKTFNQWNAAVQQYDDLCGLNSWKENHRSPHYDWRRIRDDLCVFRRLVDASNIRGIMNFSRARLMRNLVGINDRRLYTVLTSGTKRLIEEYISEVVRALQLVCVAEDSSVSTSEKLSFFNETRHAFGRSALLLSGGATLGLYHVGVCKALHDNGLLPRVLSGSSVGSIMVAMLGTRTDAELDEIFMKDAEEKNAEQVEALINQTVNLNFFPSNQSSVKRKLHRLFTRGVLMDINILKKCVKANVPPLTFQEAYDRTGRIINIVVSPSKRQGNQDSLRLLNYLTAPNVLVWSAALASCAIPFVYAPQELLCKDAETGEVKRYFDSGDSVKWEDGSVQADLPMQRLSELFNINHFIVSQVNPHIIPCLSLTRPSKSALASELASKSIHITTHTYNQSFWSSPLTKLIEFLGQSAKSTVINIIHCGLMSPFPSLATFLRLLLEQKYIGDITIVPSVALQDYKLLLINPTPARLRACLKVSELETWKVMSVIKGACEIEFTLDDCVRRMRGVLILEELEESRKLQQMELERRRGQLLSTKYNSHHSFHRQRSTDRRPQLSRVRSWSTDFVGLSNSPTIDAVNSPRRHIDTQQFNQQRTKRRNADSKEYDGWRTSQIICAKPPWQRPKLDSDAEEADDDDDDNRETIITPLPSTQLLHKPPLKVRPSPTLLSTRQSSQCVPPIYSRTTSEPSILPSITSPPTQTTDDDLKQHATHNTQLNRAIKKDLTSTDRCVSDSVHAAEVVAKKFELVTGSRSVPLDVDTSQSVSIPIYHRQISDTHITMHSSQHFNSKSSTSTEVTSSPILHAVKHPLPLHQHSSVVNPLPSHLDEMLRQSSDNHLIRQSPKLQVLLKASGMGGVSSAGRSGQGNEAVFSSMKRQNSSLSAMVATASGILDISISSEPLSSPPSPTAIDNINIGLPSDSPNATATRSNDTSTSSSSSNLSTTNIISPSHVIFQLPPLISLRPTPPRSYTAHDLAKMDADEDSEAISPESHTDEGENVGFRRARTSSDSVQHSNDNGTSSHFTSFRYSALPTHSPLPSNDFSFSSRASLLLLHEQSSVRLSRTHTNNASRTHSNTSSQRSSPNRQHSIYQPTITQLNTQTLNTAASHDQLPTTDQSRRGSLKGLAQQRTVQQQQADIQASSQLTTADIEQVRQQLQMPMNLSATELVADTTTLP